MLLHPLADSRRPAIGGSCYNKQTLKQTLSGWSKSPSTKKGKIASLKAGK